ncbi:MAG: hypothetical protein Q7S22_08440 [Candidatus Micrarchaeota archaeon]|nr:hypothetical protein [Candidatus Micrarchaeota archaeon]
MTGITCTVKTPGMFKPVDVSSKIVKTPAFIQGGSHRIDKGPRTDELQSFRKAVELHRKCLDEGLQTTLGCMVNDLAIPSKERPKNTGTPYQFPEEYLKILQEARIPIAEVVVFYESSLRNGASQDARRRGVKIAETMNEYTGFPVPVCASIMGRFYKTLEEQGFAQVIGVYTLMDCGPEKGAKKERSGYDIKMDVVNFYMDAKGNVYDEHF